MDRNLCHLSGTVDYLLAIPSSDKSRVIGLPILVIIVQVKQDNLAASWGHCLAALVASDRLSNHMRPVYGIVTNGKYKEKKPKEPAIAKLFNTCKFAVHCYFDENERPKLNASKP